jgi:hypothetical protein
MVKECQAYASDIQRHHVGDGDFYQVSALIGCFHAGSPNYHLLDNIRPRRQSRPELKPFRDDEQANPLVQFKLSYCLQRLTGYHSQSMPSNAA